MNVKEIFVYSLCFLENGDVCGWCDLFYLEGIFEFFYVLLGWKICFEGCEIIWVYMCLFFEYLIVCFIDVQFYEIVDFDLVIGEFYGDGVVIVFGGKLVQDYILVLCICDGQILFYCDFWNLLWYFEVLGGVEVVVKIVQGV